MTYHGLAFQQKTVLFQCLSPNQEKKYIYKMKIKFKIKGRNENLFSDQLWFKISSRIHMSLQTCNNIHLEISSQNYFESTLVIKPRECSEAASHGSRCCGLTPAGNQAPHSHSLTHPHTTAWREENWKQKSEKTCGLR